MRRIQNDTPGPGQDMAIEIIELAGSLYDQGNERVVRWIPGYREIEGNELADL